MTSLLKKLNFKNQNKILVLHSPSSFESELREMSAFTSIVQDIQSISEIDFALIFVLKQNQINTSIDQINPKLKGDAILWYCYPKGSSKKYKCDFNRDTGWEPLGTIDLECVRQVAIDEDWSALRFRKIEYIKSMVRDTTMAISESGKKRVDKSNRQ
ncbi:MAG TPA: hypothetical protein PK191_05350 [Niabella sp.]|nr:hypothetical protein [Niabella sp.]HOZ97531.1 hypothetical protein [Niabella sp.]HQW15619.1 hypothetical protein [Niabella sp.]HQX20762.1 hypothetical protein [Niabella sp.]HQX41361.1 hypothetical protein [Niabella sp.]